MLKGSEVTEKGECQEARRARLQETAASDVPLGATVGDAVLLPWNSDHNFQHSLLGLLENSEMGAQGEMVHFLSQLSPVLPQVEEKG